MTDADLVDWVDELLAAAGHRRAGDLVLHRDRSWARIYRAPTDQGPLWVKAATSGTAAEVALYPLLAGIAADHVLVPLGTDLDRGWLLLPDAGPSLHDQLSGQSLVDAMSGALGRYAGLQQQLAPRVADVLACGVTDMSPTALPIRFDEALAAVTPYAKESGADQDLRRLHDLRPAYVEWCAELADTDIAPSLDHNDLHAGNVVGHRDRPRFYDWGDSVVAHPFASLLTVYDTFPAQAGPTLRDAYLAEFGEPATLRPIAALACRVALVARALVWLRALGPDPAGSDFAHAPFAHLCRLLDP